jgi:hypothetical protein
MKFKIGDKVKIKRIEGINGAPPLHFDGKTIGKVIDVYTSNDYVVQINKLPYGLVFCESALALSSEIEYNHPYTKIFK